MAETLDLGSLLIHLGMDARQYFATIKQVENRMKQAADKMVKLGTQMTLRVTAPLAAIGAIGIKSFASFDSAMTTSLAIMGDMAPEVRKQMSDLALEISKNGVTSAKDLAKSYFFLASAGLDAQQSMASLNAVNQFAIAGHFDMATATDLATDAQSALGLTVDDATQNMINMTRVTDVLIGANTLANASAEQFALALTSQAGPAMRTFKIELEAGVAVLAAYADQGIKAEEAGNMLSRMIRLMTKGFKDHREGWKKFKIDIFDTSGELKAMHVIIGDLSNVLDRMSTEQKISALEMLGFQARSQQAILPLIGLQDRIEKYHKALLGMKGITKEVAEKQMKAFSAQLTITKNKLTAVAINIGSIMAPTLLRLNDLVAQATELWDKLNDETKKQVIVMGAIAAAIGPVILSLGLLGKVTLFMTGTVKVLSVAFFKLSIAMTGPLGIAIMLAAVAFTVRAAWVQNVGAIKDKVESLMKMFGIVGNWMAKAWKETVDNIIVETERWLQTFDEGFKWLIANPLAEAIKAFGLAWLNLFKDLKSGFRGFVSDLVGTFAGVAAWAKHVKDNISDALDTRKFSVMMQRVRDTFKGGGLAFSEGFVGSISESETAIANFLKNTKSAYNSTKADLDKLGEDAKKAFKLTVIGLGAFGGATLENLSSLMDAVKIQFGKDADAIVALIKEKIGVLKAAQEADPGGSTKTLDITAYKELVAVIDKLEESTNNAGRAFESMPLQAWFDNATDLTTRLQERASSALTEVSDEMVDFLVDGKANFKDFAVSVLKDMMAIMIRAQIMAPMMAGLSALGIPGLSPIGSITPSVNAKANGGIFSGGFQAFAAGGIATQPTLGLIGEGGMNEAIVPLPNGKSIPVEMRGGGRGAPPNVIINNKTDKDFKQEGQPKFNGKDWVVSIVAEDINSNGTLRQLIGGLRR